jgi:hypothetical protein
MRLSKFILLISLVTIFALLYVYQQTEILRLAYTAQKKTAIFEDLLDKNSVLRYNLGRSVSLVRIGSRVSEHADFQMPDTYQLVRLLTTEEVSSATTRALNKESIASRIFGIKRQAEANTVNPLTAPTSSNSRY